jgi:hypothetical protein
VRLVFYIYETLYQKENWALSKVVHLQLASLVQDIVTLCALCVSLVAVLFLFKMCSVCKIAFTWNAASRRRLGPFVLSYPIFNLFLSPKITQFHALFLFSLFLSSLFLSFNTSHPFFFWFHLSFYPSILKYIAFFLSI